MRICTYRRRLGSIKKYFFIEFNLIFLSDNFRILQQHIVFPI